MASYIGDSIGDAARSEERARERWLNLQLANRDFLARQQARRDAIEAQNAANAMAAHERSQAMSRADRADAINMRLGLEEQDYERRQNMLDTLLGLDEAEKNRKLQRELNTLRNDNYLQRLQQTEDQRTFGDIAKRIAADEIRDIPSLQDAEGGRLGSDEWVDLVTRLGQHQSRMKQEAEQGPEMAAREATAMLRAQSGFEADPVTAMNTLSQNLARNRMFAGKVLPDFDRKEFKPVLGYKYSGPDDAIDWYRPGGPVRTATPTSPTPAPAAPARDLGFIERLGMGQLQTALREAFPESPVTPEPVAADADTTAIVDPIRRDPVLEQKLNEIKALIRSGMDKDEAALIVARKYSQRGNGYNVRTF